MNNYVKYTDPLDGEYSIFKVHDEKGSWVYDKFHYPYPVSCCEMLDEWSCGDKLRHKSTMELIIFESYNSDKTGFYRERSNCIRRCSEYIKAPGDNL